ncbi:MAG TPA: HD-GYP domain-containing protein, partial [Limnochordia bacterium]
ALAATIDAKDPYTKNHSQNVARYAASLARELGWSPSRVQELHLAALMHDVGKIGVPDAILKKPGPLTPEEKAVLDEHPVIGARILSPIARLKPLLGAIRHHHEWYDGSGYPDGLAGEQIPIEARVLAVADTFDAITSDRVYRKARSPAVALGILEQAKGNQLDPELVDAFARVVEHEMGVTLKVVNGTGGGGKVHRDRVPISGTATVDRRGR